MESFIITEKYSVLHFDERPFLFIGFNDRKQIVIGSFLYEDDEERLLYFNSVVSNTLALSFLNRHISYLNVLAKASEIYIVKKDYDDNVIDFIKVFFDEINPKLLPLKTAYCPPISREIINNFQNDYIFFYAPKYLELKIPVDIYKFEYFANVDPDKFHNNKSSNLFANHVGFRPNLINKHMEALKRKSPLKKIFADV